MEPSKVHISGMDVEVEKDIFNKSITVNFTVGRQKIGFVRFTRMTDTTYLFELNIKGRKVGLTYTIPQNEAIPK